MAIELREVTTDKALKEFIRYPRKLYAGNEYWVPSLFFDEYNTLHWKKNAAFEHCEAKYWMAYRDGEVVGRIAAILNRPFIEKWGDRYLRFGWIDFEDDPEVSAALVGAVEAWAREEKLTAVHGPLGFTDLDQEGMLVEGFDELSTLATIYNYPYYQTHLERLGYGKDVDWVEYQITVPSEPIEKISRAATIVKKRLGLRTLQLKKKKELMPYAMELFHVLDEEYSHLYGTVPLTEAQMKGYVDQYFGFVSVDMVPIVVNQAGELVAFGIVMPSLSRALQKSNGEILPLGFVHLLKALKTNTIADMYLVAVKSEYQGKGVNALLMDQILRSMIARGITLAETNPELETNIAVQGFWKYFEHRQHKRRRCVIKHLHPHFYATVD